MFLFIYILGFKKSIANNRHSLKMFQNEIYDIVYCVGGFYFHI